MSLDTYASQYERWSEQKTSTQSDFPPSHSGGLFICRCSIPSEESLDSILKKPHLSNEGIFAYKLLLQARLRKLAKQYRTPVKPSKLKHTELKEHFHFWNSKPFHHDYSSLVRHLALGSEDMFRRRIHTIQAISMPSASTPIRITEHTSFQAFSRLWFSWHKIRTLNTKLWEFWTSQAATCLAGKLLYTYSTAKGKTSRYAMCTCFLCSFHFSPSYSF